MTGATRVVVGHDMRPSSPWLAGAFADGATGAGADVVLIGLASTDQLYFASGHLGLPGAMFTASHNPAAYNGIKLCRAGAAPIGKDTGLAAIRDLVAAGAVVRVADRRDRSATTDVLDAYAAHLLALAPVRSPAAAAVKVVVDAGNGMAGHTAPAVFDRLGDRSSWCRCTSSSTAPSPTTRPTRSSRRTSSTCRSAVLAEGADIGLAFDGDADRCFLVDERGRRSSPSTLTALIAARELAREPGATVIHNLITRRAVPQIVTELGGTPVRTRVGHSFIKATMAETDAVFGGEHSGHFYFRDFWRADSGMLAALHALAALAETDRPLSARCSPTTSATSRPGEINSTVADQRAVRRGAARRRTPTGRACSVDHLDGLTVTPRRLVVQCAGLQHRAAAPAQRRGRRRGNHDPRPRRRPHRDQERPVNLDPALLEIIVCPDCHGSLAVPGRGAGLPVLRAGLPGPRRHPGAAGRRGPAARTDVPMAGYFDESRLDDERALGRASTHCCAPLAESGARVRREAGEAAEATAEAVERNRDVRPRAVIAAGPDSRLLRAVLEPWCPVPFVAWPGPGAAGLGGRARPGRRARPRAARTMPPPPPSPRRCGAAARSWSPARPTRWSPSTPPAGGPRSCRPAPATSWPPPW